MNSIHARVQISQQRNVQKCFLGSNANTKKEYWQNIAGGGVTQARISAFQILYNNFVRNLFGVFKDLCR